MPVCPLGSVPQAGVAAEYIIDNAFMRSLLPDGLEWLGDFLPYIIPLRFSTALFCAEEPPGYPDMSLVEWAALVVGSPPQAAQESGRQVAQALYNILWYRLCECITDPTPTIPSPPAAPVDLPAINPPDLVERPVADPCIHWIFGPTIVSNANITLVARSPIPAGAVNQRWRVAHVHPPTGSVHNVPIFEIKYWDGAGTALTSQFQTPNTPSASTAWFVTALPAGAVEYSLSWRNLSVNNCELFWEYEILCPGDDPTAPAEPCCPPDENQLALLNRILQMVTLVQRQSSPFAYVYGDNHAGLTDDGELAVSGLIGVAVDVTTLPDRAGRIAGTPETIWEVGYVSLGTTDGWEHSRRIDHDGTLLLPPGAGAFTRIGYTLTPGVVVAIRELVREP